MKHRQTETRHLFVPDKPEDVLSIVDNNSLTVSFMFWLDRDADEDKLKDAMEKALPDWTKSFVHVFVGLNQNAQTRYIAVSWQETPDRRAIHWGEERPDRVEKYTVQGSVSYMLNRATIAAIVTMLPPERK